MGQNKPSCSFPQVETIVNRFLVNFYLRKVNFELLEIPASDRFHYINTKMGQEGQMGQNKPSCSFPRVETIANRFLMNFYLKKVNFVLLEIPASDRFLDKSIKNGSSGTNGAK